MVLNWSDALPVTAALIHGTGFVLYNIQAEKGDSKPNPVSWLLWAFLSTLNAVTFIKLHDNGIIATLQFITGSLGCIGTFGYVLITGKFGWPKWYDVVAAAVGIYGIYVWKTAGLDRAYLLFVAIIIWSFLPTVWLVLKDPRKEKQTAWWFWTVAFSITAVYVYFFRGGWTTSMIVPIGATLAHGIVPVLVTERRKARWIAKKKARLQEVRREIGTVEATGARALELDFRTVVERATENYWNLRELKVEEGRLVALGIE